MKAYPRDSNVHVKKLHVLRYGSVDDGACSPLSFLYSGILNVFVVFIFV